MSLSTHGNETAGKFNWRNAKRLNPPSRSSKSKLLVSIEDLRPTQMAVGMRAVVHKRRKLETRAPKRKQLDKVLSCRPIPVIRGPGDHLYMVDNHHFGLALWQAEIDSAYAVVLDDLSRLTPSEFWWRMEAEGRLYPYNETGRRVSPAKLPVSLNALRHDPYRDLAWQVRRDGGFAKADVPFAEFHWAGFFRAIIPPELASRPDRRAIKLAKEVARSAAAADLPGYLGARS
ncbi:MAG: hypothetical protein RLZ98_851 [Pseudomonadota bacterium]|jgi:hypothetical protein